MKHEIDMKKSIELIKEKVRYDNIKKELIEFEQKLYTLQFRMQFISENINESSKRLKSINTLKGKLFGGTIVKKEIEQLQKRISDDTKDLEYNSQLIKDLELKIKQLKEEMSLLEEKLQGFDFKPYESVKDSMLVITDSHETKWKRMSYADNEYKYDDFVMVHSTDFFPKDGKILTCYDGNKTGKILIEYKGVVKEVQVLIHRHTVHFTLNSMVQNVAGGFGAWNNQNFIIVEPFASHKEQFKNIYPSDSFTWGSVQLQKPYYLIREDAISQLPVPISELDGNVVLYRGDARCCLNNFLDMLGYPLMSGDANYAAHRNSIEGILEKVLNQRDLSVNFLLNNSYDGKEKKSFTLDEIVEIINLQLAKFSFNFLNDDIAMQMSQKLEVSDKILQIIVSNGIKMQNDGTFYFDDDKNVYDILNDYSKIDLENLKQVIKAYKNGLNKQEEKVVSNDVLYKMTVSDIWNMDNFNCAQLFFKNLDFLFSGLNKDFIIKYNLNMPYLTEDGLYIKYFINENDDYIIQKIADVNDSLDIAYVNFQQFLIGLGLTEDQVQNKKLGKFNAFYLFFVMFIILMGIVFAKLAL